MASIPSPIRKWVRRYITGEGSEEVASQSPVQSVNSQTGDVTISTGGGVIPSSQTVASYSDLPLTDRSQAEIWFVTGERDIVASTELSPVVWRSMSDFTVVSADIPDSGDLQARYVASDLSLSDGDNVSTWPDATGNGYDLTAGTAPTYKTGGQNGKPFVRFDGTDDVLDVTFTSESQPNSIWLVAEVQTVTNSGTLFDGASQNTERFFLDDSQTTNSAFTMFAGNTQFPGVDADTSPHIHGTIFDTSSSEIRIDGSQSNTGSSVGSNSLDGITLGATGGRDANAEIDVYEMLYYPQDKTSAASDIENYLNGVYGVY